MVTQVFAPGDLEQLLVSEGGPHLSIFLPPPVIGNDTLEEEKTRLSNLIRSAHTTLTRFWMSEIQAVEFLRPLEALSIELWQQNPRRYGIAIFVNNRQISHFRIDHKLDEQLTIKESFQLRPLLPSLDEPDPFLLLSLSQQRTALYYNSKDGLKDLSDVLPDNFEESEAQLTVTPQTQVRAAALGGRAGQGVVFHGQGGVKDAKKVDLENYLKHVDKTVSTILKRYPGTDLILAGVDTLTAMFRAISHCDRILDETVSGNVDNLSSSELSSRVSALVNEKLHHKRNLCRMKIREHKIPVAMEPEQILAAAGAGRIATLFIDQAARLTGIYSAESGTLTTTNRPVIDDPADNNCDLIELAALGTLKAGGTVYSIPASEMPIHRPMAAALRF